MELQKIKCITNCKSVSGGNTFERGKEYEFIVEKQNDDPDDYECVLKTKVENKTTKDGYHTELVDSRYFEDYDPSFIDSM